MTELSGIFKMLAIAKRVARIAIQPDMMEKIIALKHAVILQHEIILLGNKRLQYGGAQFGMIERAQKVTNIMQKRANDIFLITAIFMGAGRGLQAVLQAVNGKAAKIAFQHLQMGQHTIRQGF